MPVLADARVYAALPSQDFEKAKAWYKEKLGMAPSEENPGGALYDCGQNSRFLLFPSAGVSNGSHTQVSFAVDDIQKTVAELKGNGVKFEEYDTEYLKTTDSIAELGPSKGAWFKDGDGNMIAVFQMS